MIIVSDTLLTILPVPSTLFVVGPVAEIEKSINRSINQSILKTPKKKKRNKIIVS